MARYMLQAKRPHEKVFTEWCSTDDYEVIQKSIKIIESYGYQYQVKENEEMIQREQIRLNQLKCEIEQLKRNLEQCENGYRQEMHLLQCKLADAKNEVERLETENLILKQNRLTLFDRLDFVERARAKGAIEIIEHLENEGLLNMTPTGIAELKKKYTEGNSNDIQG